MQKRIFLISLLVLTVLIVPFFYLFSDPAENEMAVQATVTEPDEEALPRQVFGLPIDSFIVIEKKVMPAQFLANILMPYNIPYATIHQLEQRSDTVFNVRRIAAGRKYVILCSKDDSTRAEYFIYQPNEVEFIVCGLQDSVTIRKGRKEVETITKSLSGVIETSLYDALTANGGDPMLAMRMADIFAWTIDFYRIQKGDWFKVIYEEKKVEGKTIGFGEILAIDFNHEGKDFYGFLFEQDGHTDYFDEEANSLRKAFLKSPLKFSRLTSGFTQRRFHPVQKRWKAHLGTDYAAPHGTPILATGDGKVMEARYKRFNGNYVKIKHNGTYQTQYLHMSSIRKGISPGVFVKQGEVIGYVGSTGLATGPHVCYRFWKHGSQVDHLKEDFPPSEPVSQEHKERFEKEKQQYITTLQNIHFDTDEPSLAQLPREVSQFLQ